MGQASRRAKMRLAEQLANPRPPCLPALDMADVKHRLNNLRSFLIAEEYVYLYARYVALVLNDELVPSGFLVGMEIARDELARDYRGPDEVPVPHEFRSLVRQSPSLYWVLRRETARIAEAVCPWEFAEEVVRLFEEHPSMIEASIRQLSEGMSG